MSTQIYIQPQGSGCQPEYTKIAAHSFMFHPTGLPGIDNESWLYTGGDVSLMDYTYPIWSADIRDTSFSYTAGNLVGTVKADAAAMGIPLPINLVPNDTVTISGNAFFNNANLYIEVGWEVSLIVGVYYFNCKEVIAEGARMFTFIPVSTAGFDENGNACFNADVTLGSNFDFHDTRILVGYDIIATCPEECVTPAPDANVATVSYTLDIERPCQVTPSNFIIKNCCEGSITELVNIPGLVVGNFHVDDEGNCWEVMEQSNDVTNFTRTFTDIYTTCLECEDDNGCPLNLTIESCCVDGIEYVTGSLPGLVVGDTFVDNHGLCWYVKEESGAPISEESITVVSIIEGDCETCTTENPCPYFYYVLSCCTGIGGIIALPDLLSVGDAFVDTNGICWVVDKDNQNQLPTMYGIVVDTVYPIGEGDTCDDCTLANPCPTEYFITIKSCCDPQRVEVASVPANSMIFAEGTIFQDVWKLCWEVISFSTTGVETYAIYDWDGGLRPTFDTYKDCKECSKTSNDGCLTMYELKQCGSELIKVFYVAGDLTIGGFYQLYVDGGQVNCWEVLDYGYPVFGDEYSILLQNDITLYATCNDCSFTLNNVVKNVIWQYCEAPGVTYIAQTTFSGLYTYALQTTANGETNTACIQLLSVTTDPVNSTFDSGASQYDDCPTCIANY
jgi:hypothetical protein